MISGDVSGPPGPGGPPPAFEPYPRSRPLPSPSPDPWPDRGPSDDGSATEIVDTTPMTSVIPEAFGTAGMLISGSGGWAAVAAWIRRGRGAGIVNASLPRRRTCCAGLELRFPLSPPPPGCTGHSSQTTAGGLGRSAGVGSLGPDLPRTIAPINIARATCSDADTHVAPSAREGADESLRRSMSSMGPAPCLDAARSRTAGASSPPSRAAPRWQAEPRTTSTTGRTRTPFPSALARAAARSRLRGCDQRPDSYGDHRE